MFSPLFIAPASNLSLLYQRSGRLSYLLLTRKLRIQVLKFSLIFNLIVQVVLTLIKKTLVDLVVHTHLISQPTPVTKKYPSPFTDCLIITLTVTLNQLLNPFQVDFRSLVQGVGKYTCTLVYIYTEYTESSGGFQFVTKNFSMC